MTQPIATQDVFEIVLARPVVTPSGEHPSLVHLWWRATDQGDRVVQVYIDGSLAATTLDPSQREMWLTCNRSAARRIELLALPATDGDATRQPRPDLLRSWTPSAVTEINARVLRDDSLPVATRVSVSLDGSRVAEAAMWGGDDAGPGLGMGELGMGPLGVDGESLGWRIGQLARGDHDVGLAATDPRGIAVAAPSALSAAVDPLPAAATAVSVNQNFVLSWTE
ncbi:MAG: hypothetical protein K8S99_06525 [Planctomycetes bacterium]|nr:hypothetical protein [Planctomycetota bacterium]